MTKTVTSVERFGDLIAEAITEWLGERCPDYTEGCACCEVWKQYDSLQASAEAAEKELTDTKEWAFSWSDRCTDAEKRAKAAEKLVTELVWQVNNMRERTEAAEKELALVRISAEEGKP